MLLGSCSERPLPLVLLATFRKHLALNFRLKCYVQRGCIDRRQPKTRQLLQLFEVAVRQGKIMEFMHELVQMTIPHKHQRVLFGAFISQVRHLPEPTRKLRYCVYMARSPSVFLMGTEQKEVLASPASWCVIFLPRGCDVNELEKSSIKGTVVLCRSFTGNTSCARKYQ